MTNKRSVRLVLACIGIGSLGLLASTSPAAARTKTATFNQCVSAAVAIPDGPPSPTSTVPNPIATFAVPVRVPRIKHRRQTGVVTSFNSAGVRIAHTDDGDLALILVSPGGKAITLSTYRDQSSDDSGNGYGSGTPSCAGSLVQFGDAFQTSISTPGNSGNGTPITGSFKPEQPLSTFVGGPARGFWTLIVEDLQSPDIGTINALSLNFTYRYKVKRKRR
jgi:hypothetical protein